MDEGRKITGGVSEREEGVREGQIETYVGRVT